MLNKTSKAYLLHSLADRSDEELFELLDDDTQQTLRQRFVAELDADDLEQAVFEWIDASDPEAVRRKLRLAWQQHLAAEDLLVSHRHEIEANLIGH